MENFYILGAVTCLSMTVFAVLAYLSDKIEEKVSKRDDS